MGYALYGTYIQSIKIPSTVYFIDIFAFGYCKQLTSIVIPNSVKIISEAMFISCPLLQTVTLSDNLTLIENQAFQYCSNLTNISILKKVVSIGNNAFENCFNLVIISMPEKMVSIGKYAFYKCFNLAGISIPDNISTIDNYAFANCYKIKNIIIPGSVKSINEHAFYNCSSVTSITIPNSLTTINVTAFIKCSKLTKITSKLSHTINGIDAFYSCNISEITFEGSNFDLINNLGFKEKIKSITYNIPKYNSLRKANDAEYLLPLTNLTKLQYINIENINDMIIPAYFINCDDVEIFIAHNINAIDPLAFSNCAIKKFTYYGTNQIEGDFLKNAKSCKEIITTSEYKYDQLGGMDVSKIDSSTPQPSTANTSPGNNDHNDDINTKKSGKKSGTIAGIVIGIILGIAIIAVVCFFIYRKKFANTNEESSKEHIEMQTITV